MPTQDSNFAPSLQYVKTVKVPCLHISPECVLILNSLYPPSDRRGFSDELSLIICYALKQKINMLSEVIAEESTFNIYIFIISFPSLNVNQLKQNKICLTHAEMRLWPHVIKGWKVLLTHSVLNDQRWRAHSSNFQDTNTLEENPTHSNNPHAPKFHSK